LESRSAWDANLIKCGTRHKWTDLDESVEAALVRTQLMGSPHPDDGARIRKEIDKLLSHQKPNGVFGDDIERTGTVITSLLKLGASPSRPEISRGLDVMLAHTRPERRDGATAADDHLTLPMHNLHAACRAGRLKATAVRRTLQQTVDDPNPLLLGGCPWSTSITLQTLWLGRTAIDTIPVIRQILQYVNKHINDAGCLGYRDPWGLVSAAATIDLPEAGELCQRLIPLILRVQNPGGGWGSNPEEQKSFGAIAALKRHGFLEKLKSLPKLQSDWDVIGSIPLPGSKTGGVVWRNDRFWVINWESGELQALSRKDGAVIQRIPFLEGGFYGVGLWDGKLAVTQAAPVKRVIQIDPDSGEVLRELPLPEAMAFVGAVAQVNSRIWVADTYLFPGFAIDPLNPAASAAGTEPDPASPDRLESYIAGPCPVDFAVTEDGVWHADFFAGLLIKSGKDGKLLQWAAMPDGWTDGIAWDGERLWAKSPDGKRLLMLKKSVTAPGDVQQPGGEKALQNGGGISVARGITGNAERDGTASAEIGLRDGLGIEVVRIESGTFSMGSENGGEEERPVHLVTIPYPFYLGAYEVTQDQWEAVMGSNPSRFRDGDHPVEQITWPEIQRFLEKLSVMNPKWHFRLPTEAEWEYAARAGTQTEYFFGDNVSALGTYAWHAANSGQTTHPVGAKKPNPWGFYDMYGNVWEWVQDRDHANYEGAPSDGSAWESIGGRYRIVRGGSWDDPIEWCRSASRPQYYPAEKSIRYGFRIACTPK